ncbi:MAG: nucleoside-triphosphatase [Endomicrobiales bacterium]|jgi:nucleoside-triphosphatase
MNKNVVLTGKPGCGKTTLIREVCHCFPDKIGGFFTDEVRIGSQRDSFVLKTFDGQQGVFAKKGMASPVKLNKYGIDLNVLESLGISALRRAIRDEKIIVIDEIGSMEMFSKPFRSVVADCLNSPCKVLASIRYNSQPFTSEIKAMTDTTLLYLSRSNAAEIKKAIEQWLCIK